MYNPALAGGGTVSAAHRAARPYGKCGHACRKCGHDLSEPASETRVTS
ncbi:hypothetical protein SacxiDRAFT_3533 [Saccharomonospora xinjiangensis XJ-54]|uniref:Uncharacterized protein n=1 Tax=Saccharomonospora xinjiangensis XJ-54 TaxID=882086 RepID=I0V6H9_9PSEU|nr:hypothetical protein SacxiDRAFT_3533 [Saccharomonospora xinjiangensis XJ-54]